jgi:hypothetical protein
MSAINDALRRASSAAKTTPASDAQTPPALPAWPLPPAPSSQPSNPAASSQELPPIIGAESSDSEFAVQPQRRSALPFVFALLVILLVFGAGASFLYARKNGPVLGKMNVLSKFESDSADDDEEEEEPANEVRSATRPASVATVAATTTTPATVATPAAAQPAVANATTPPVARPAVVPPAAVAVATTPTAPVRFPALKLQSIYYRPTNPSVMINGKTLFVSDEISGVTVADITASSVTLVLSGQTNILTLR